MLPWDMKSYRAPSAFDLIHEDVALVALFVLLFAAWIADRMGWLG